MEKIDAYNALVFSDGSGIDVMGKKIDSIAINNSDQAEEEVQNDLLHQIDESIQQKLEAIDNSTSLIDDNDQKIGVVAFLLRYDSLDTDLVFWNNVNNYLSKFGNVRLTAYCGNDRCIEAIKMTPSIANFTVLEYGEAMDMQAVIGADENGEFWLRGKVSKKVHWRNDIMTPYDIAMTIGLGL